MRYAAAIAFFSALVWGGCALAQPDPSGIDFVTIGAPGNRGYDRETPGPGLGRGAVAYEYRIGRYEMTSGQWAEFLTAALNRPDPIPWVELPSEWGGGGSGSMLPAGGVTWRTCAIFTNWLCNDKRLDRAAFLSGAYDVSTFGYTPEGLFTDQREHTPGARYYIPTLDEWMKASYYDPNRQNADGSLGGWWLYANGRDTAPRYGPPPSMGGTGQANAGFTLPGDAQFGIPLGAYTDVTSPWGLYDTAGGTAEYTESILSLASPRLDFRRIDGSAWATSVGNLDAAYGYSAVEPSVHDFMFGFRVASSIPSSPTALVVALGVCCAHRRRGKTPACGPILSSA